MRLRGKSIRFRLTLWYTLILMTIMAAFSILIYFSLKHSLVRSLDASIRSEGEWVAGIIDMIDDEADDLEEFEEDLEDSLEDLLSEYTSGGRRSQYIQIRRGIGEVVYHSEQLDHVLLASREALQQAMDGKHTLETIIDPVEGTLRFMTLPVEGEDNEIYLVQVGASFRGIQRISRQLLFILLVSGAVAAVVSVLGGSFLAQKALKPVDEITKTAQKIEAENLSQRLEVPATEDELSRLATTLNEMIDRLERSFQQIRQFTADASHELRTPLTAMRGQTEVTLRRERSAEEYRQVLESNLEEAEWMSKIVENLLTLSRTDSGEIQLDVRPVQLGGLFQDACEECKSLAAAKNIEVFLDKIQEITIFGDEIRLRQMLLNLVDNAVKYTPDGGQIRLSLEVDGKSARIQVKDTGIGISKENLPYIFDRFFRADKARSREMGGSGLGLNIVQWIINAHHGTIDVTSKIGEGSCFTIYLPVESCKGG